MSFKLSGSKSKGSTTENFTKTSTPNVPDWLARPAQGLGATLEHLGASDPYKLVSPVDPLQQKAGQGAVALGGDMSWLDSLMAKGAPTVASESLLTNLDEYQNPYRDQVVDGAMADFDANAGKTRAMQDLDLAGSGAFGGSGSAITKSLTEGELSRARGAELSGLLADMFNTSAGLSNSDAARRQAANEANAGLDMQTRSQQAALGFGRDENARANIASQAGIGEMLRAIDTEQRQAPFNLQDWLTQNFAALNPSLFTGQTDTGSSKGTSKGSSIGASAGFSYGGQ